MVDSTFIARLSDKAKDSISENTYQVDQWIREYNERFAELIVRECAEIAYTAEPYQSSDNILRHFGISDE